jgi:hypothetical protein
LRYCTKPVQSKNAADFSSLTNREQMRERQRERQRERGDTQDVCSTTSSSDEVALVTDRKVNLEKNSSRNSSHMRQRERERERENLNP